MNIDDMEVFLQQAERAAAGQEGDEDDADMTGSEDEGEEDEGHGAASE
jgi:hypothetical protein